MTIPNVVLGQVIDPTTFGNPVVDQLNSLDELEDAWQTYTATLAGITPGTTGLTRRDRWIRFGSDGKTILVSNTITLGTGGAVTAWPTFTLPAGLTMAGSPGGSGNLAVAGTNYPALPYVAATDKVGPVALNASGTYLTLSFPGVGVPAAWAAGASISQTYLVEVA